MEATNQKKEEQKKKQNKSWDFAIKALIVVGLILLLIIGILLPIKLVPNAVSDLAGNLTSIFTGKENPSLSASNSQINSGDTVNLTWKGVNENDGTYSLTYQCVDGVKVFHDRQDESGNTVSDQIICETPYIFSTSTDRSLSLAINSYTAKEADVAFHLSFTKNGQNAEQTIGDTTVKIINSNGTDTSGAASTTDSNATSTTVTTVVDNSNATTTQPAQPQPAPEPTTPAPVHTPAPVYVAPRPDLAIHLLATGVINKQTGQFIPNAAITSADRVAVQFEIVNQGGAAAGTWRFVANLPTTDPAQQLFSSAYQPALVPGGRIITTVSFDGIRPGQNLLTINVDPDQSVYESNENNNTLAINTFSTGSYTNPTNPINNGGKADLEVKILGTGTYRNGTFHDDSINDRDRGAIQFEVTNIGGETSDDYGYEITIPSGNNNDDDTDINRDNEQGLAPGARRIYTVAFDANQDQDGETAEVRLQPNGNDASSGNNHDDVRLEVNN